MKLTDVCDFQGGSQPPKNEWSDMPKEGYIRMLQIRDYTQENSKVEYVKVTNSTKICKEKDILIARYGASIGKILTGLSGAYNVAMMKVIIDENKVDRNYIYNFLKSNVFQNYIKNVGQRAAQAGFNKEELSRIEIDLPKIKEQIEIATKLDTIQKIISIRKKQIESLDDLIKCQFIELFGKIDKRIKVKDCCSKITDYVASGSFASIRQNVKCYNNPEYAIMVRTADFANNFSENLTYTDKHGYDFLHNSNLFGGELLLSNIGASIGKVHRVPYLNVPMTLAPNAIMLKGNKEYLEDYLQYYFLSDEGQVQLKSMTTATAMPKFNKTQLKEVEIIKAPIELQNQFAKSVQQIKKQKFELQKNLEEMERLQKSLMNKYFRG